MNAKRLAAATVAIAIAASMKRNTSGAFADWNPRVSCVQLTGNARGSGGV
jgi:hypothetical protein